MTPATAPLDGGISIGSQEDEARDRHQEAAEDEQFAARRAAFVAEAINQYRECDPYAVMSELYDAARCCLCDDWVTAVRAFADVDGWPATLRAIAQAMAQSEKGK